MLLLILQSTFKSDSCKKLRRQNRFRSTFLLIDFLSLAFFLLPRLGLPSAPQPLYNTTLLGSRETTTAPLASCESEIEEEVKSLQLFQNILRRHKLSLNSGVHTCSLATTSWTEVPFGSAFDVYYSKRMLSTVFFYGFCNTNDDVAFPW